MSESCGKCIPCRTGTAQMHNLLTKICDGEATHADLELLVDLCDVVKNTSLCGLGMTAPNPVLSTLRYFRDEYLAHIENRRCPAGVCACHGKVPPMKSDSMTRGRCKNTRNRRRGIGRPRGPDHPRGRARKQHQHPHALPPRWPLGCRRLPSVPGGDEGLSQATGGLRPASRGRHGGDHHLGSPAASTARSSWNCSSRTQSCLLGLRVQRSLRAAVPGPDPGHHSRPPSLSLSHVARWTPPTRDSWPTTTDASYASAASACATRLRARTPGTWGPRHQAASSPTSTSPGESTSCTGCGKCVQVCPTGALVEKGKVGRGNVQASQFLPYLNLMREER